MCEVHYLISFAAQIETSSTNLFLSLFLEEITMVSVEI